MLLESSDAFSVASRLQQLHDRGGFCRAGRCIMFNGSVPPLRPISGNSLANTTIDSFLYFSGSHCLDGYGGIVSFFALTRDVLLFTWRLYGTVGLCGFCSDLVMVVR